MAKERIQKLIAKAGIASRRKAEEMMLNGRVRLNGHIIKELGTQAHPYHDRIEVDGKRIVLQKPEYYILNKPREVVSTLNDPEGREHIGKLIRRIRTRVFPVGRLDYHTSGAILLTNDGALSEALLKPNRGVPKVYVAKTNRIVTEGQLSKLRQGVILDDGYKTKPTDAVVLREDGKHSWIKLTLHEGKNRQIHRMMETLGNRIMRLSRLSFAGIDTEGLTPGDFRPLKEKEIERLAKGKYTS